MKKILRRITAVLAPQKNSGDYRIVKNPNLDQLRKKYRDTWKDESIPYQQLQLIERQSVNYSETAPVKALVSLMKKTGLKKPTILEVGCASGYYSEFLPKAGVKVNYQGCDYSPSFIRLAKERYPQVKFKISDATRLDYEDGQFEVVISGCCLLHIIDYQKAIAETARVAKDWAIFHRTPVLHLSKTTFTKKIAYGLEMVEILFNEEELTDLFDENDLTIKSINSYVKFFIKDLNEPVFIKSYLCQKNN